MAKSGHRPTRASPCFAAVREFGAGYRRRFFATVWGTAGLWRTSRRVPGDAEEAQASPGRSRRFVGDLPARLRGEAAYRLAFARRVSKTHSDASAPASSSICIAPRLPLGVKSPSIYAVYQRTRRVRTQSASPKLHHHAARLAGGLKPARHRAGEPPVLRHAARADRPRARPSSSKADPGRATSSFVRDGSLRAIAGRGHHFGNKVRACWKCSLTARFPLGFELEEARPPGDRRLPVALTRTTPT